MMNSNIIGSNTNSIVNKNHHHHHHYALDAAIILQTTLESIRYIEANHNNAMNEMQKILIQIQKILIRTYYQKILQQQQQQQQQKQKGEGGISLTLEEIIRLLKQSIYGTHNDEDNHFKEEEKDKQQQQQNQERQNFNTRSSVDSMLFRLIVILQLSLVRINDIIIMIGDNNDDDTTKKNRSLLSKQIIMMTIGGGGGLIATVAAAASTSSTTITKRLFLRFFSNNTNAQRQQKQQLLSMTATAVSTFLLYVSSKYCYRLWMYGKLSKSTMELYSWLNQWEHIMKEEEENQYSSSSSSWATPLTSSSSSFWQLSQGELRFLVIKRAMDLLYASFGIALEVTKQQQQHHHQQKGVTTVPYWRTSLTAMAAASYLSVVEGGPMNNNNSIHRRAERAIYNNSNTSSITAQELIQNAWGMVYAPPSSIKVLTLHATKLLKGAAIAEHIVIANVPCLVLSKNSLPPRVITTLKNLSSSCTNDDNENEEEEEELKNMRQQQQQQQKEAFLLTRQRSNSFHSHHSVRSTCSDLPTIDEEDEEEDDDDKPNKMYYDIIFHLTGGGFFVHTLLSDIPYLLDWSKKTGAIVICPEYSLLPQHTYPVALNQITDVYRTLLSLKKKKSGEKEEEEECFPSSSSFNIDSIIVTGESTGGNLATAMCVKLSTDALKQQQQQEEDEEEEEEEERNGNTDNNKNTERNLQRQQHRQSLLSLPDALMLSCPALNLSRSIDSRYREEEDDPVLPAGLISAISDAYTADNNNNNNNAHHPYISPIYVSDEILSLFPSTLIFTSSNDPLLDDAIYFHKRLKYLGRISDLRAPTTRLPHAYWGLGSSIINVFGGERSSLSLFPEAQRVQYQCEEFLQQQFNSSKERKEKGGSHLIQ